MAVLRLPYEDRLPNPGDAAQVVLIDLAEGGERVVATTRGWETQMGANIGWGADDTALFFNDVEPGPWRPFARRLDPGTGRSVRLDGTIYQASPDGRHLASCNMATMRRTQPGYGVVLPGDATPRHVGLADDDGLFLTDTDTGAARLLVSIRQLVEAAGPEELRQRADDFEVYGFHTKWHPRGERMIVTLRWFPAHASPDNAFSDQNRADWEVRFAVYTLKPDGSDIHLAVGPDRWTHGGHHINFFPQSTDLSMNLALDGGPLRLVRCGHDGAGLRPMTEALPGSGHPSVHPRGMVLTDTYTHEKALNFGDGTGPLRWIDPAAGTERALVRINTAQPTPISALRVDPHPAWDRAWRWVAFNAFVGGTRRVFVADTNPVLEAHHTHHAASSHAPAVATARA